jgi:hypothetical protein
MASMNIAEREVGENAGESAVAEAILGRWETA